MDLSKMKKASSSRGNKKRGGRGKSGSGKGHNKMKMRSQAQRGAVVSGPSHRKSSILALTMCPSAAALSASALNKHSHSSSAPLKTGDIYEDQRESITEDHRFRGKAVEIENTLTDPRIEELGYFVFDFANLPKDNSDIFPVDAGWGEEPSSRITGGLNTDLDVHVQTRTWQEAHKLWKENVRKSSDGWEAGKPYSEKDYDQWIKNLLVRLFAEKFPLSSGEDRGPERSKCHYVMNIGDKSDDSRYALENTSSSPLMGRNNFFHVDAYREKTKAIQVKAAPEMLVKSNYFVQHYPGRSVSRNSDRNYKYAMILNSGTGQKTTKTKTATRLVEGLRGTPTGDQAEAWTDYAEFFVLEPKPSDVMSARTQRNGLLQPRTWNVWFSSSQGCAADGSTSGEQLHHDQSEDKVVEVGSDGSTTTTAIPARRDAAEARSLHAMLCARRLTVLREREPDATLPIKADDLTYGTRWDVWGQQPNLKEVAGRPSVDVETHLDKEITGSNNEQGLRGALSRLTNRNTLTQALQRFTQADPKSLETLQKEAAKYLSETKLFQYASSKKNEVFVLDAARFPHRGENAPFWTSRDFFKIKKVLLQNRKRKLSEDETTDAYAEKNFIFWSVELRVAHFLGDWHSDKGLCLPPDEHYRVTPGLPLQITSNNLDDSRLGRIGYFRFDLSLLKEPSPSSPPTTPGYRTDGAKVFRDVLEWATDLAKHQDHSSGRGGAHQVKGFARLGKTFGRMFSEKFPFRADIRVADTRGAQPSAEGDKCHHVSVMEVNALAVTGAPLGFHRDAARFDGRHSIPEGARIWSVWVSSSGACPGLFTSGALIREEGVPNWRSIALASMLCARRLSLIPDAHGVDAGAAEKKLANIAETLQKYGRTELPKGRGTTSNELAKTLMGQLKEFVAAAGSDLVKNENAVLQFSSTTPDDVLVFDPTRFLHREETPLERETFAAISRMVSEVAAEDENFPPPLSTTAPSDEQLQAVEVKIFHTVGQWDADAEECRMVGDRGTQGDVRVPAVFEKEAKTEEGKTPPVDKGLEYPNSQVASAAVEKKEEIDERICTRELGESISYTRAEHQQLQDKCPGLDALVNLSEIPAVSQEEVITSAGEISDSFSGSPVPRRTAEELLKVAGTNFVSVWKYFSRPDYLLSAQAFSAADRDKLRDKVTNAVGTLWDTESTGASVKLLSDNYPQCALLLMRAHLLFGVQLMSKCFEKYGNPKLSLFKKRLFHFLTFFRKTLESGGNQAKARATFDQADRLLPLLKM
ncbi:unnamed protein product [Amoebophrya sp. A25]|nr:unnamed protein product [Amoebophrya sp. A25]|eukprot:GSA25T00007125001.1